MNDDYRHDATQCGPLRLNREEAGRLYSLKRLVFDLVQRDELPVPMAVADVLDAIQSKALPIFETRPNTFARLVGDSTRVLVWRCPLVVLSLDDTGPDLDSYCDGRAPLLAWVREHWTGHDALSAPFDDLNSLALLLADAKEAFGVGEPISFWDKASRPEPAQLSAALADEWTPARLSSAQPQPLRPINQAAPANSSPPAPALDAVSASPAPLSQWKDVRGEWTDAAKEEMRTDRSRGHTDAEIAARFGISRTNVSRLIGSKIAAKAKANETRRSDAA